MASMRRLPMRCCCSAAWTSTWVRSPSTPRQGCMKSREQAIRIAAGERAIDGTLVVPGDRIPGVLFVHGWGGSQQQYLARAREIAALGCICLTFDLRGHAGTRDQLKTVTR